MPQVRLYPQDDRGVSIPAPPGPPVHLPRWRLRTWVRVGSDPRLHQAAFDTGAPTVLLSRDAWLTFADAGDIEWLSPPPTVGGPLHRATVLGGTHPLRLGRVVLGLADLDGGTLPGVPVYAQCLEDGPGGRPVRFYPGFWSSASAAS